jgi:hypothetical protein
MTNESVSQQEPAWPRPNEQQVLQVFAHSGQDLCGPAKKRAGRPATVSWSHLCLTIMLCFLRGWNVPLEVWRLIRSERLGGFAPVHVSDQAISNRMERAAIPLQWLVEHVSAWLRRRLTPWEDRCLAPWATAVSAADASTLDQRSRFLPWWRPLSEGDTRLLAGQISALFAVRLQQWVRVDWWPDAGAHCMAHVLTLVERVQAGALLLFDRGSLRFALFDQLSSRGIWWISRDGNQVSDQVSPVCSQADGVLDAIVYLGTTSANQARSPVRLIQVWLHGRQYRSLTNRLDPHVLTLSDVGGFDTRRWDIERAFRARKDHLNRHHLWSAKWAVVQVQRWCCLILAQVSHAFPVEMAGQAGVEVFEVSLDLLVRLTPGWLSRGLTPREHAVRFGRDLGLLRPSTRHRMEVPWVDPCWGVPPPPEAVQPREMVRSRSQTKGTGTKSVGLVRLKAGKLSLLE